MNNQKTKPITVEILIKESLENVWNYWSEPQHIVKWYHAGDDWHAPAAENDLKVDGHFKTTMAAKDGSASFDFEGVYTAVEKYKVISYKLGDGRMVQVAFLGNENETKVVEIFDPEQENSLELQQGGWQAILNNFKKYVEQKKNKQIPII